MTLLHAGIETADHKAIQVYKVNCKMGRSLWTIFFCTSKSRWRCGRDPFCQWKVENSWLRPGLDPFATDGCWKAESKASPMPVRRLSQTSARNERWASKRSSWAALALSLPPQRGANMFQKKLRQWWMDCSLFFSPSPCWQTEPFSQPSVTNAVTHKRRTRDVIASAGTTRLCADFGKHIARASLALHPSLWSWKKSAKCLLNLRSFYVTVSRENRGI